MINPKFMNLQIFNLQFGALCIAEIDYPKTSLVVGFICTYSQLIKIRQLRSLLTEAKAAASSKTYILIFSAF